MRSAACARRARWICVLGLVSALALAGCDATPRPPSPSSYPTSLGPGQRQASGLSAQAPTSSCPPTAQLRDLAAVPERQGTGEGATLWALFFPTTPLLTVGEEVKVVWRMTGRGDFSISATGPDGTVVNPVWGPEQHMDSSWNRPGEEWGTGWVFPAAGCWTINARRASGSGYLVLRVAE